ncbi:serine/threonine protein kinase cds1, putative [Entamoeba invadens IP1]|uniref:non-specific serine/threonine protein kinase n=1 Tax=Entamoeba invadens IP1 TaxID=370355 RepID=A0A0A1U0D2_ENTIV|nr:serine/threonine protein kinase cds1, putative [Entamoeba invadens IP1]ELP85951.1 serine/threonine protein kinase cds1, putative [Entamoeba invadens IP1]|eukprot:XP_004185297.1 serine/threonine protein kinase cds1, putative [Entamoeba invadens IP1]
MAQHTPNPCEQSHWGVLINLSPQPKVKLLTHKKEVEGRKSLGLNYNFISRNHFSIECLDDIENKKTYMLSVLSANGLYVNDSMCKKDYQTFIKSFDTIRIFQSNPPQEVALIFLSADLKLLLKNCFFEKYRLLQYIGKGSFGSVFKAMTNDNKVCAVKVMDVTTKRKSEVAERESEILTKLEHNNIVRFFDCIKTQIFVFLVMEFVEGQTLANYLNQHKSMTEKQVQIIMRQVFDVLTYLHKKGVVHRDIKLENVMLCGKSQNDLDKLSVKVMDFGFGKNIKNDPAVTKCGTEYYSPPELFKTMDGQKYDGTKADVWSAGVMMYALLTFKFPFEGGTIETVKGKIKEGAYKESPLQNKSDAVKDLLNNIFVEDPEKRYSAEQCLKSEFFPRDIERAMYQKCVVPID